MKVSTAIQHAFLKAINDHSVADESLSKVLEQCEAKWDRLFRDAPLGIRLWTDKSTQLMLLLNSR